MRLWLIKGRLLNYREITQLSAWLAALRLRKGRLLDYREITSLSAWLAALRLRKGRLLDYREDYIIKRLVARPARRLLAPLLVEVASPPRQARRPNRRLRLGEAIARPAAA